MHSAAAEAIQRARTGGGPPLLECNTYRTRAHAEGMGDFTYRTREEVDDWKTRGPLERLRESLLAAGAEATELDAIDAEIAEPAAAPANTTRLQRASRSTHRLV